MNPFEMVVLIVIVVMIAKVVMNHSNRKYGKKDSPDPMKEKLMEDMGLETEYYSRKDIDPYLAKMKAMEDRIRVLERIATDKGRSLSDEISDLK